MSALTAVVIVTLLTSLPSAVNPFRRRVLMAERLEYEPHVNGVCTHPPKKTFFSELLFKGDYASVLNPRRFVLLLQLQYVADEDCVHQ